MSSWQLELNANADSTTVFTNNGTIEIESTSNGFYNDGGFVNNGTITFDNGAQSYAPMTNSATGTMTVAGGQLFNGRNLTNDGHVEIGHDANVDNGAGATISNHGTFTQDCGATIDWPYGDGYSGTAPVINCDNPTIKARLSSAAPKTAAGWYRAAVTVTYQFSKGGTEIDSDGWPAPFTDSAEAADRVITRQVTDTDGGFATSTVSLSIDRTPPVVTISGATTGGTYARPRHVTCAATDALAGVTGHCTVTRTRSKRVGVVAYTAAATDLAGNVGATTGHYTVAAPATVMRLITVAASSGRATFGFAGRGDRTSSQCALVHGSHKPHFRRCSSPKKYRHLAAGHYTFEVRAVGPGGPDRTPARHRFTISR